MYGWEFPPHISGGLGVACHGIVSGLAQHEVDISLVLPRVETNSADPDHIHLFDCRHCSHDFLKHCTLDFSRFINIKKIDSLLSPYMTPQSYQEVLACHQSLAHCLGIQDKDFFNFQGDYGSNLFVEVLRYAMIAGSHAAEIEHDIIHAHEWMTILAGIEAKKISKKPLIFHIHALETDRNASGVNPMVFEIEKYGMQQADRIIAVSEYTKNCIIRYYGINPAKISVCYNGLLPEQIISKNESLSTHKKDTVLFLGRVTQQKGPFYFLEAAKKVLSKHKEIEFVMAGDGDLWREMIHKAANWRIGSYVHFTKFLTRPFTSEILKRSKVFVMPSISEPFGLACLEAVSHHVPVVLSKQSGVSEVVQNCLKVDFWDTDQIAKDIIQLVGDKKFSMRVTQEAHKELGNLLWSKQVKSIISVYEELYDGNLLLFSSSSALSA